MGWLTYEQPATLFPEGNIESLTIVTFPNAKVGIDPGLLKQRSVVLMLHLLIRYLNLRSTILSDPHSVGVNMLFF